MHTYYNFSTDYCFFAVAPRITNASDLTLVAALNNTLIFCQAEGFPMPSVIWYHNTSELMANTRVTINNKTMNDLIVISEITISAAMMNDSGYYTCNFTSSITAYGIASSTIVLYVQGRFC